MTRAQAELLRFLRIDRKMLWKDVYNIMDEILLPEYARNGLIVHQACDILGSSISEWIGTPDRSDTELKEPEI